MTSPQNADGLDLRSWGFAEDYVLPSDSIAASRRAAAGLGIDALPTGTVSTLRLLAAAIGAKQVVEVGTGSGTSGLALFEGMQTPGVLTSIDPESDRQGEARKAFLAAGIPTSRFRLIAGIALDVLPRLSDGAYDLVFINGDKLEYVEYVAQALRLLRHGGVLVLNDALWRNRVADPDNEDDEAVILREALGSVLETEEFTPALLPVGQGLLVAVKA
ncbi:O-methyltransferase [Tessaracoccus sp. SD287]|uniref:O-methyltransferase n=1 Tax=Tessaracoccus sp. SD287 TaxID=2782008 RepID=UPI001A973A78|nr:O-methyltransferase [Tessaracoccus sp. SD287]